VARVFVFRIPVFWFLQRFTQAGEKAVGIVMAVSNISVAVAALLVGMAVIHQFKKDFHVV
jgi:Na+-driven multidrug efflux pump